jgi:polysaccharide export outer membrane protein
MAPLTLNKEAHMKTATLTLVCSLALAGTAFAQTAGTANPSPIGTSGTKPASDTTTSSAASTANDYRLAAGDKLRIEVYKDDKLSQPSLQIRPDGKITLPLIGDIKAEGLRPADLEQQVQKQLATLVRDPRVTVIVHDVNGAKVYVTGQVLHAGAFPLRSQMNVLQALAMAGGLAEFADKGDIAILRADGRRVQVDYDDLVKGKSHVSLGAGDTVVVP